LKIERETGNGGKSQPRTNRSVTEVVGFDEGVHIILALLLKTKPVEKTERKRRSAPQTRGKERKKRMGPDLKRATSWVMNHLLRSSLMGGRRRKKVHRMK